MKSEMLVIIGSDISLSFLSLGPFTLFAPTDNAFADLSDPMRQLLQSSTSTLKDVLKYHVVEANVTSAILNNEQLLDTVEMARIRINVYTTEEIRVRMNCQKVVDIYVVVISGVIQIQFPWWRHQM